MLRCKDVSFQDTFLFSKAEWNRKLHVCLLESHFLSYCRVQVVHSLIYIYSAEMLSAVGLTLQCEQQYFTCTSTLGFTVLQHWGSPQQHCSGFNSQAESSREHTSSLIIIATNAKERYQLLKLKTAFLFFIILPLALVSNETLSHRGL